MPTPMVSVVIPTFQRAMALEGTIAALCAVDYPATELEIIVVDDGSSDVTSETVRRFPRVTYVQQENSGVAAARNRGAEVASGELLIFVDDDIIVDSDNVRKHLSVHAQHQRCLASGHWEFDADVLQTLSQSARGRFRLVREDFYRAQEAARSRGTGRAYPPTLPAANLSIKRNIFLELGGFDARFPVGAEDQEFSWRARAAGCTLVHDYNIHVVHNDQHRGLASLCSRDERAAIGFVYFARMYPEVDEGRVLDVNGPPHWGDSPRLLARKMTRAVLSRRIPLAVLTAIVSVFERLRPNGGWPLDFLYRALSGLHIFRGTRRGLRLTANRTWRSAHRAH